LPNVETYLSFDGAAAEAMSFYARTLDAKLEALLKFGDMPHAAQMPPGSASKVAHARLAFKGGGALMASDSIGGRPYEGMKGFSVALTYATASEARRVFDALADGGMVLFPLQPSFFAEAFGMLVDRFGVPWSISGGPIAGQQR
jgi:PhnB protein